jgi:hypothetical protein
MMLMMMYRPRNLTLSSDDTIRRFLLGQLNAREQSTFERCLFTDNDFETRVRLAELALTDDYDRLSRRAKDQFHKTYLVTTERKQTLAVSQALHDRFSSPISAPAKLTQTLKAADISQPAWRYAFAALILLLVFATVWRGIKEPQIVQRIIPKPVTAKPTATPALQPANHPNTIPSPNHVEEYPAMPPHETVALSVPLNSGSTAENPALVVLPKDEHAFVRFELQLPNDQVAPYRAELLTIKGESIIAVDSLSVTTGSRINLDVPAKKLQSGDYQISLSGQSATAVANYFVRVQ